MSDGPVLDTLRIESVADVADAVREYVLVRPDGAALPAFEPGAHVTVRLASEGEAVVLAITDDGIGFDTSGEFPGHLGLRSMQERARDIGGTLEIQSAPGEGTRITLRIPHRQDHAA